MGRPRCFQVLSSLRPQRSFIEDDVRNWARSYVSVLALLDHVQERFLLEIAVLALDALLLTPACTRPGEKSLCLASLTEEASLCVDFTLASKSYEQNPAFPKIPCVQVLPRLYAEQFLRGCLVAFLCLHRSFIIIESLIFHSFLMAFTCPPLRFAVDLSYSQRAPLLVPC